MDSTRRAARIAMLTLALALPFTTFAQPSRRPTVDVESIDGPLSLVGVLQRSGSHGCSQSFASSDDLAAMQLTVDAQGRATLTMELQHHDTFGPSPGRYAEGERDFTYTTERGHAVLMGNAVRRGAGLAIRFERMRESHVRYQGMGTLPLPEATETPVTYAMHCEIARADVLPKEPAENERATSHSLLRCAPEGAFHGLSAFESPTPTFGRMNGVRVISTQEMWAYETTTVLRLAD